MKLDEKTAAMLQAIADMPDDVPAESISELFQKFGTDLDPDAVTAFLKAASQQDRPEAKAIIEQRSERTAAQRREYGLGIVDDMMLAIS
jgi:hypothetical protein